METSAPEANVVCVGPACECKDCRYFSPRYYGIGLCTRAGGSNAQLFVQDGKDLFVSDKFCCVEFQRVKPTKEETL